MFPWHAQPKAGSSVIKAVNLNSSAGSGRNETTRCFACVCSFPDGGQVVP